MKIEPGWVDTAGRTRTWRLLEATGEVIAEVTRKRDALRLLARLEGK
jgi:hypothetical protein